MAMRPRCWPRSKADRGASGADRHVPDGSLLMGRAPPRGSTTDGRTGQLLSVPRTTTSRVALLHQIAEVGSAPFHEETQGSAPPPGGPTDVGRRQGPGRTFR